MKTQFDYAIVGAGPAGVAAALRAGAYGLSVLVLDEQQMPGGQIFRAIERMDGGRLARLGKEYRLGKDLVDKFHASSAAYVAGAGVWQVTPDGALDCLTEGRARRFSARRILIATGAQERPVAIPGWTLPGVMGAAAVDVLFKSAGLVPDGRVVLAGSGPLLYLVTCRLLDSGVKVKAVLDTRSLADYLRAARHLPRALPASQYLFKGLALRARILQGRVPYFHGIRGLQAAGSGHVQAVTFSSSGRRRTIEVDFLLLHDGVVPNVQLTRQLECEHRWDPVQRYWKPHLDKWGNSSLPGIAVAGDTSGIYGAKAAELAGELAALETAYRLNRISRFERDRAAGGLHKRLQRERSVRPFLDHLFRPQPEFRVPRRDDTIVCRCEEITAGQIRQAAALGDIGPNQIKAQIRCGMGLCQGRLCGLTVAEVIADYHRRDVEEVGYFRIRPPIKPLPLEALANLELNA